MTEHASTADKRIVAELKFGSKTAKRVGWEAFEFALEGPHLVRVTNASYGFEKADHSYLVGVEDRDGLLVPAECECPADKYNEAYACKHRVACATTAGPVVLQAAVDYPIEEVEQPEFTTVADRLRADGGPGAEGCPNGDEYCDGPDGESFPCFDCYELEEGQ
jgi:hypothetical protein